MSEHLAGGNIFEGGDLAGHRAFLIANTQMPSMVQPPCLQHIIRTWVSVADGSGPIELEYE